MDRVYEVLSAKVFPLNSKLSFLEREGVMIVSSMHADGIARHLDQSAVQNQNAGQTGAEESIRLSIFWFHVHARS